MICRLCRSKDVSSIINFGPQPPSNRYHSAIIFDAELHVLELGVCNKCNLIQLIDPMLINMVCSRFSWINYNEPERHLDKLVEKLVSLKKVNTNSKIVGLTYKDDSTLKRFEEKGFKNLYKSKVLNLKNSNGHYEGLETIQQKIVNSSDFESEKEIDILIVRHVLEHAHDLTAFLKSLIENVNEDGYLVFEIPDSKKFLLNNNYHFLWEEHVVYFTEKTLRFLFEINNLKVVNIIRYEFTLEDSLIAIVKKTDVKSNKINFKNLDNNIQIASKFALNFRKTKKFHKDFLSLAKKINKKIAIFGAGHLATKYINFFEIAHLIDIVIDDSNDKQGLYMPGNSIIIKSSKKLDEIDICLLALSPESQKNVLESISDSIKKDCEFYSIFDNSLTKI